MALRAAALLGILAVVVGPVRADVVLNEILYHAPDDLDELQFIELYNTGGKAVDLAGWKLTRGVQYQFPAVTTIAADGYLVVCKNLKEFKKHYGFDAAGQFSGALSHSRGHVELVDARGKRIDDVKYGSRAPWEPPQPNEELRLEVYRPPYLFRGPRPQITGAPQDWQYATTVTVHSPQAGGLLWAQLISPGVTTHAFDCHQRLVDLPITAQGGGQLQVTTPAGPAMAPPGWYMLTVVDHDKVPSVATWVHLT